MKRIVSVYLPLWPVERLKSRSRGTPSNASSLQKMSFPRSESRKLVVAADGWRDDPRHRGDLLPTGEAQTIFPRGGRDDPEYKAT